MVADIAGVDHDALEIGMALEIGFAEHAHGEILPQLRRPDAAAAISRMTGPAPAIGDALPELAIPLDRTLIVATAIASQDFEDVHHDPAAAQGRGTPDIFMSINATNGFIDRYITDWTGPQGRIRSTSLRLGVPNFPGRHHDHAR